MGRNTSFNLAAVAAGLSKETIAIDYDSFVVRVPGNLANESDLMAMFDTMHHMLLHQPEEIAKRQRNMMAVAPHLTFGLGRDAHKHDDAFRRILYTLEILAVGSLAK